MGPAALALLALIAAGVFLLAAAQAVEYLGRKSIISRAQFLLRMGMAAVLLLCLGGIYAGASYPWRNPLTEFAYWMVLLLASFVVAMLAIVDLRWCVRLRHKRRAELFRNLASLEEMLHEPEDKEE